MADVVDRANDINQEHLDAALARMRITRPAAVDPDCEQCGVEIPAKRREALPHCTTCVACQQLLEAKKRNYR